MTWQLLPLALLLTAPAAGCKERTSAPAQRPKPATAQRAPAPAPTLPDPFALDGGGRVKTVAEWPARRAQLQALLERVQYGVAPTAPARVTHQELSRVSLFDGQATRRRLRLDLGKQASMQLGLTIPAGRGSFPVIVHIDHRPELFGCAIPREVTARGYILAELTPTELCPDRPGLTGPVQKAHPDATWGTIACWAWGASRAMDFLLKLEAVDPARVVVTGHSRSGKAALWTGALDQRVAVTAPMGSGCGGAGSYLIRGQGCERLADIVRNFPHWFVPGLSKFAGEEERLPFDQHLVYALVAPRALITLDATGDAWANPYGTGAAHLGARPVFRFLGAADRIGISFRPGRHELADRDWRTLLDFADQRFGREPQPGSAGRTFETLVREVDPAPFSWRAPGEPE